ncbi:hypothetical protein VP01_314g2 [Puccinia sorghi]|uniref:Uncharacterized protein n=1 Tax=Puccinia sorghi TaxID=27349 RepID=A0A0L6UYV1_9BASI|nr:hypothetical protein VP01_314g2 [Puccinia sorghi]
MINHKLLCGFPASRKKRENIIIMKLKIKLSKNCCKQENYFQLMHKHLDSNFYLLIYFSHSSFQNFDLIYPFRLIYFGFYFNTINLDQYNAFRDTSDCFLLILMSTFQIVSEIARNGPLVKMQIKKYKGPSNASEKNTSRKEFNIKFGSCLTNSQLNMGVVGLITFEKKNPPRGVFMLNPSTDTGFGGEFPPDMPPHTTTQHHTPQHTPNQNMSPTIDPFLHQLTQERLEKRRKAKQNEEISKQKEDPTPPERPTNHTIPLERNPTEASLISLTSPVIRCLLIGPGAASTIEDFLAFLEKQNNKQTKTAEKTAQQPEEKKQKHHKKSQSTTL